MKTITTKKLQKLMKYIQHQAPPHRFLPDIATRIDRMISCVKEERGDEELKKLALGLGLFISDDFEFSESETGAKILETINSILRNK